MAGVGNRSQDVTGLGHWGQTAGLGNRFALEIVYGNRAILSVEDSKLTLGHPHQPLGNVFTH